MNALVWVLFSGWIFYHVRKLKFAQATQRRKLRQSKKNDREIKIPFIGKKTKDRKERIVKKRKKEIKKI